MKEIGLSSTCARSNPSVPSPHEGLGTLDAHYVLWADGTSDPRTQGESPGIHMAENPDPIPGLCRFRLPSEWAHCTVMPSVPLSS